MNIKITVGDKVYNANSFEQAHKRLNELQEAQVKAKEIGVIALNSIRGICSTVDCSMCPFNVDGLYCYFLQQANDAYPSEWSDI